jgi:signal transduction histidine kinase
VHETPEDTVQYLSLGEDRSNDDLAPGIRKTLEQVNRKVAAAESLEALVDFLFDATTDICPCDRIALAFVDEDGRITAHHARAAYQPLLLKPGYSEGMRGSSLERVVQAGELRVISDLEAYAEVHPESSSSKLLLKEGVRSSMTCPLSVDGRNVGLLFRSSRRPHAYDALQARMHSAIAERLGQAVAKAWRIEQLTKANRAYTEMLGFVSHELKNPVSAMVMLAETMAKGYVGEVSDQQRDKLHSIVNKGHYLLSLVREYLDMARMDGSELRLNSQLVPDFSRDLLDPSVDVVSAAIDEKNMTVSREIGADPLPIECDTQLLKIVLVNLLGNAAKYGREGGEITVSACREQDSVTIAVRNEGPGFSEQDKTKLFRRFSRLPAPELKKQKGTGVGLYTVWRIIQLHGGRIWASSEQGKWAKFSFRLPQPLPQV